MLEELMMHVSSYTFCNALFTVVLGYWNNPCAKLAAVSLDHSVKTMCHTGCCSVVRGRRRARSTLEVSGMRERLDLASSAVASCTFEDREAEIDASFLMRRLQRYLP